MRIYRVVLTPPAEQDLLAVQRYLFRTHRQFGRSRQEAVHLAQTRAERIRGAVFALGRAPHQGQPRPELSPAMRSVTKDRAIFYFELDEQAEELRLLAIFFGGQDHQRAMLRRALHKEP